MHAVVAGLLEVPETEYGAVVSQEGWVELVCTYCSSSLDVIIVH